MTRRSLLAAAAGALRAAPAPKRPNILFILPDQLRAQALGHAGDPNARTPHIDALARQGLVFRHTVANTPVCCPARAIMLTGRYAHKNGMTANDLRLRESEVTYAEVLRQAGYRTGFIGKWHLDGGQRMPGFVPPGPRRQGFEYWAANQCSHAHFNTQYFRDDAQPIPMPKFEAEGWTDLGIEFLQATKQDTRPFFLTIQMGPPHDPYQAPPEYAAKYDAAALKLRANWQDVRMGSRRDLAQYYAMVECIDDQVGRLLKTLDDLGLAEDTVVVFSSDHGDMLGSQGKRLKRKPWDESIRVPGIVRYPRRTQPGRTSDVFFTHADFAPTFLGLAGLKPPAAMQGADLSPVIRGESSKGPDSAFLQIFGPFDGDETAAGWRGVRTARYTYARYQDQPWVLYDNQADPYQQKNLAGDPAAQGVQRDMEQRLAAWMRRTGDNWSFNWTEKVEDAGRLYKTKTYFSVDEYLKEAAR